MINKLWLELVRSEKRRAATILRVVGLLLIATLGRAAEGPKNIPVESFLRWPAIEDAKLSPDGKFLGYLTGDGEIPNVVVMDIQTGDTKCIMVGAVAFEWATNTRIVAIRVGGIAVLAADRNGENLKELVSPEQTAEIRLTKFLAARADEAGWILMGIPPGLRESAGAVRLNVFDGRRESGSPIYVSAKKWLADREGRLRIAIDHRELTTIVRHRPPSSTKWETLVQYGKHSDWFEPLGFEAGGNILLVKAYRGKPTLGLYRYDLSKREYVEVMAEQAQFDVEGLCWPNNAGRVLGAYYEADLPKAVWFDSAAANLQERIDKLRPGKVNRITSQSDDGSRTVIYSYSDQHAGAYLLFDESNQTLQLITATHPWLGEVALAQKRPISFQARDGMRLHGYLTIPPGREDRFLPMIVLPHDGPWERTVWSFDPRVQFLASRGYAVLQINYRGSTGYGRSFFEAGFSEWHRSVVGDLADATKWAVDQGVADPKRLAVLGVGYGGFAAQRALALYPGFFRCGISLAGFNDLDVLLDYPSGNAQKFTRDWRKVMWGDLFGDRSREDSSAPRHQSKVVDPLLLVSGEISEFVNAWAAKRFASELKKQGSPVEPVVIDNHSLSIHDQKNQAQIYLRVEAFLAKHLAMEAAGVDQLGSGGTKK